MVRWGWGAAEWFQSQEMLKVIRLSSLPTRYRRHPKRSYTLAECCLQKILNASG